MSDKKVGKSVDRLKKWQTGYQKAHVFIVMNFVVVAQLLCFVLDGHTDFFPNSPGLFFYNFNVELFRLKPSILIIYSKLL